MLTQGHRDIAVSSPLGEDVLVFRRMSAREGLSELFLYSVDVLTMRPSLDFNALLGQPMTVRLSTASSVRYFSGLVTRFSHRGSEGRYGLYRAELRPWLWFLTRNRDSRIFQERTVPEIVKSVLRERGFSDIDDRLSGHYQPWEYCVQHQESDFAFISRLMEHEGIYYYFTHQNGRHTLVLADGIASHDDLAPSSRLRFSPEKRVQESLRVVTGWTAVREVTAGVHTVDDYDFERPRADLRSTLSMPQGHALSEMEVYEYPGNMAYQPSGRRGENSQPYARSRLEEAQAVHETVEAESNVSEISAGVLFNLTHHPVGGQNREYLISAVEIALESDAYEGGGGGSAGGDPFLCRLWALPGQVQFRAPRRTPWPRVLGPQTAFVAGKAGEEIWTDRFGRIKVHFPWDRDGEANENSSCWIRVAQVWAGKQWGGQFLPRIGQEVIVSFLDGDPNRPIVTGTVYNGEATPPFALPEKATQSGWRSNSSKNAKGHNEFRFEDKAGKEQVYIHGQKDMDVKVRATKRESMGGDRHQTVGHDKKQMVEGNHHDITWTDRYQNVDTNLSQMVGLDKHEEIGQNYALKAGLEIAVEAGLSISLKGSGGFITIGPTGVTISGNLVLINSGGSPSGLSAQVTEPDEAAYAWDGEPGKGGGAPRAKRGSRLAANRGRIAQIAAKRAATEWGAAKAKIQAEQAAAEKLQKEALETVRRNKIVAAGECNGVKETSEQGKGLLSTLKKVSGVGDALLGTAGLAMNVLGKYRTDGLAGAVFAGVDGIFGKGTVPFDPDSAFGKVATSLLSPSNLNGLKKLYDMGMSYSKTGVFKIGGDNLLNFHPNKYTLESLTKFKSVSSIYSKGAIKESAIFSAVADVGGLLLDYANDEDKSVLSGQFAYDASKKVVAGAAKGVFNKVVVSQATAWGMAAGTVLIPIPGVGTAVGGAVGFLAATAATAYTDKWIDAGVDKIWSEAGNIFRRKP